MSAEPQRTINGRDYQLTFSDEFMQEDSARFGGKDATFNTTLTRDCGTEVRNIAENGEEQLYLDDNDKDYDVFEVSDGQLTIQAHAFDETRPEATCFDYASGMINTHGTFSQLYGYFGISARLEGVQGAWPAFWLLPEDGSWPPEIDVFEVLGTETDEIHQTSHGAGSDASTTYTGVDAADGFHVYGLEWTPYKMIWTIDGVVTRVEDNFINQEMFMVANLAMGGWAGKAADDFDGAKMEIDYIRAYEVTEPWPAPDLESEKGLTLTGDKRSENTLEGSALNDKITGGDLADAIVAGDGNDKIMLKDGENTVSAGQGNDDIKGGKDADIIFADGHADRIMSDKGDDAVYGGTGNDRIDTGDGDDKAYGQEDNDSIALGKGNDRGFGG